MRQLGHTRLTALHVDSPTFAWDFVLGTEWFRLSLGQLQLQLPLENRSVSDVDEVLRVFESSGFICVRFRVEGTMLEVSFVASDEREILPIMKWKDPREPLIVTGASSNHVHGLHGLLRSIIEQRAGEADISDHSGIAVHIWDLGLTHAELTALQSAFPPTSEGRPRAKAVYFRYFTFDFSTVPAHFALSHKTYAWKAEIMGREILDSEESRGYNPVLWLDAGDRLVAPLEWILGEVRENGASSADSTETILRWTHPLMLSFFADRRWLRSAGDIEAGDTPCAGGVVALDRDNVRTISRIMRRWRACALRKECIAPVGSNLDNHRQDQAALTLLFFAADVPKRCIHASAISEDIAVHVGERI
jgi:hypothetical protein